MIPDSLAARDEKSAQAAWEIFKEKNPPIGQAVFYYKDNAEYNHWNEQYRQCNQLREADNVALKLRDKQLAVAIEALETLGAKYALALIEEMKE